MNIVFCDDEESILELYISEIEYALPEHKVVGISCPLKALDYCQNNSVDLLFTDGRMPKMNGIELAKNIKDIENAPQVILITGYVGTPDQPLDEVGISKVFNKPINYDELIDFIRLY